MPSNRPCRTVRRMLKLNLCEVHCFRQQSKVTSKKGLLCRHRTSNGSTWFCVAYCCQWRHSVLGISSQGTGHNLFWCTGTIPTSLYNVIYSVYTKLYISIVIFIYTYTQITYIWNIYVYIYIWPPLWSSGQSFWLQIQRSRVRSPALPDFLSSIVSGTGSTHPREPREVNWGATWMKKVAAPGLENRDQRLWGPVALTTWHPSIRKSWH